MLYYTSLEFLSVHLVMIIVGTRLNVADNSGAKTVECIKVLGGSKRKCVSLGDVVVVSVKTATPTSKAEKGKVYFAVIVRTKAKVARSDGSSISFSDNAAVLLTKQHEPIGTRVLGPVAREVKYRGHNRVASLAEVL